MKDETYRVYGRFLKQPIGEFFVGIVPAKIMRTIAHEDIRRLEERSAQKHIGLERPLSKDRVKEIETYIGTVDATFPNSIIVSISSESVIEFDRNQNAIVIKVQQNSATLIDGLHRLAGFNDANWDNFELIVSFFFDLDEEDKAMIFSTINLKQTKVTKSLVYDLFDLAVTRSPLKTSHDVARTLNYANSPFYHRIKLLGSNPKLPGEEEVIYEGVLTQGSFVDKLVPLISRDPVSDRNMIKQGLPIERRSDEVEKGLIFRQFFADDRDEVIIKVMLNYFETVRDTFPEAWNDKSNPLCRTIGYAALMRLLVDLGKIGLTRQPQTLERTLFETYLKKAKGKLTFTFEDYPPSTTGESRMYNDLKDVILNKDG